MVRKHTYHSKMMCWRWFSWKLRYTCRKPNLKSPMDSPASTCIWIISQKPLITLEYWKEFSKTLLNYDQLWIELNGKTLNQLKTLPSKVNGNNLWTISSWIKLKMRIVHSYFLICSIAKAFISPSNFGKKSIAFQGISCKGPCRLNVVLDSHVGIWERAIAMTKS